MNADYQTDPLRSLRDPETLRFEDEYFSAAAAAEAAAAEAPKFLGCCGPAASCCCGCSLKFALKAFATVALVCGSLGLFGSVVSIGMADVLGTLQSLLSSGLTFALGFALWNAAAEINPRLGRISCYLLACLFVVDVIYLVFTLLTLTSKSFHDRLLQQIINQFVENENHYPTGAELQRINEIVNLVTSLLIASATGAFLLEASVYLLVLYFVWSFIVRAEKGEYFLINFGFSLPVHHTPPGQSPHHPAIHPQYGIRYSQQQQPQHQPQQQQQPQQQRQYQPQQHHSYNSPSPGGAATATPASPTSESPSLSPREKPNESIADSIAINTNFQQPLQNQQQQIPPVTVQMQERREVVQMQAQQRLLNQ